MRGTFLYIDVPPTLISFAVAVENANTLICNVLKAEHKNLYRLSISRDGFGMPDFERLKNLYEAVYKNVVSKNISFATVVDEGGAAVALIKSCLGNRVGLEILKADKDMFLPLVGDIIVECGDIAALSQFAPELIAKTTKQRTIVIGKQTVAIDEAIEAFAATLENIFPTHTAAGGAVSNVSYGGGALCRAAKDSFKTASPRVFIPAFAGTNCEYDTAKRFEEAGAKPIIYVMKNRSVDDIEQSIRDMSALIKGCQMIAIPGGFSGGDEPDGSGKFIATAFKNPRIGDAVADLLQNRDGLILGICNGFQALIKLGLVPFGKISPLKENSPTLTYNKISRHVSSIVNIRVASTKSPWLFGTKLNEVYSQPVSHGEGRFVCDSGLFKTLEANGQIAAQYVDDRGNASSEYPFNPNGSYYAVEALTSPDGRILGKMGHSERIGDNLYKNREGNYDMKIFESGVAYFK
jgi:phosphoribosylformylglycinamidine synthase